MTKRRKRRKKSTGLNPEDTVKATGIIEKDSFSGRPQTTVLDDIQWVSEHLPIPDIAMADSPSARAWDWYKRYHGSEQLRSTFDNLFMSQLVKAAGESGRGRFFDEEKEEIKRLDEFQDTSRQAYEHVLPEPEPEQEPAYASANG